MKFSVLLSVYHKEKAIFLDRALKSIWDEQSLKPNEIICVEDGPLSDELYKVLNTWEKNLGTIFKRVVLKENRGLASALNEGLQHCKFEWIARMDSDDIATSDRFEKQISFLQSHPEIDILGGQIDEFLSQVGDLEQKRILPIEHDAIMTYAKKRCPFNHPTVLYKKEVILKLEGYKEAFHYEDYFLWIRLLTSGVKAANLPDIILHMQISKDLFKRRGGWQYAISEIKVQKAFYRLGFLSFKDFILNIILRTPIRLMPNSLRAYIYKKMLRK